MINTRIIIIRTLNHLITMGIIYGIFKNVNGKVKIHNKIYEQLIYDYRISKIQTS
ncbi:hypothetical protein NHI66_000986 [Clostridium botulinum]|nr:hypothetical protein [Clostridium botulinum]